jgi:phosphoglycolate phosphatase-like HAD superfamily hydrolase
VNEPTLEETLKAENKPLPVSYRTIYVDLNGVLDTYDGWRGHHVDFPPRAGAAAFLQALRDEGYNLVLFTAAPQPEALAWLNEHDLRQYFDFVTNVKGPAIAYLDDRAVTFQGDFARALADIRNFRVHWAKEGQIG